jgi:hypothetical protein
MDVELPHQLRPHSGDLTAEPPLSVYVVATTDHGTQAAVKAARSFSAGFTSRITLVIPQTVPYREPLDRPPVPIAFTIARFRKLAEDLEADLSLQLCVCRPGEIAFESVIPLNAVVLVGGVRGFWRRSRQQRLADQLTARGHRVLFVDY